MVKKTTLFCLILPLCSPLFAQFHFETGFNFANSSKMIAGVGAYVEPRYGLNDKSDLALHLGLTGFVGDDQNSRRTTTGTIPVILASYIRRFPEDNAKVVPYIGLGPGIYLKGEEQLIEGIKLGAGLRFGIFIGRSNLGFTQNLVPNDSFFQLSYGFRILDRD